MTAAIEPEIKVSQEYASLVPQLTTEEYESLKQSIKESGLYVPIIVNQDGIVLDRHHRYKACQELGIKDLKALVKEFKDKLDEQLFVIDCNLKRRQLNNFQRTELALKSKSILAAIAKKNMSLGGQGQSKEKGSKDLETLDSKGVNGEIGKLAGVSHETVRKVEKILESKYITDENKEALRVGQVSINEAYEIIAENESIEQLDEEYQPLHRKVVKALDELHEAQKAFDDMINERSKRPKPTEEEIAHRSYEEKRQITESIVRPFANILRKEFDAWNAFTAAMYWVERKEHKKGDIQAAAETLKQIDEMNIDKENGYMV
jgi:ParB-like chromosome segregation protein Spo0J